jgi:hypothetical protein
MLRVVLSHPWHKDKNVPWMGHPAVWAGENSIRG